MFPGEGGGRGAHLGRERLHRESVGWGEGEKQHFFLYVSCGPGPMCRGHWDFSLGTPFVKTQTTMKTFPMVGSFHAYGKGRCVVLRKSHGRVQRELGLDSSESSPHVLFVGQ